MKIIQFTTILMSLSYKIYIEKRGAIDCKN